MATRRCTQRELLLRPEAIVNDILGYVLGLVQRRYSARLHAFIGMSNHVHAAKTDTSETSPSKVPGFMRDFNSLVARAVNSLRRRTGNLWEGGGRTFNFVAGLTAEDMMERMAYIDTNPTAAGLVDCRKKWCGLRLNPGPSGRRVYRFQRPKIFFSKKMPEYTEVVMEAPRTHLAPREFMRRLHQRINEREEQIRNQARLEGRRFLGRKAVLRQDPTARPATYEHWRQSRPQVASVDRLLRLERKQRNRQFLAVYRETLARYIAGDHDVVFPTGTYQMVVVFRARCEPG